MPKFLVLLIFIFALIFSGVSLPASSECEQPRPLNKGMKKVALSNGSNYLVSVPDSYEPDNSWGVLLLLHGNLVDNESLLNSFLYGCEEQPSFLELNKYIGIAPHSKEDSWATREATPMLALLNLFTKYKVNRSRIHVIGSSAGGIFSGWLGYSRTDIFQSITVISASISEVGKKKRKKNPNRPVYFIVGETDENLKEIKKDFKSLTDRGNKYARLRIIKGQGRRVKYSDDFSNLGHYFKAVESGFDYPGNLQKAEKSIRRNISHAIELARDIRKQPEEELFTEQLNDILKRINAVGEKKLTKLVKQFSDDSTKLLKELSKFQTLFASFPVSKKAKIETEKVEARIKEEEKNQ